MAATIKDVAKAAGVSAATVSRVVNNDPRISESTRKKVAGFIESLGYRTNSVARSLKTSRTNTIGLISPEIPNDFFMGVAKGVEDELRKQGYSVIICCSNENTDEEAQRIELLINKCVDGMIIIPASNEGRHFNRLKEAGIPAVLADRLVEGFTADAVLVDNINGCYSAIEYLIGTGGRRIGFIGGDARLTSAGERYEGYKRALKDYCIPLDNSIIRFGDFHVESGYRLMKELVESDDPPADIFIANYFMHIGAAKYLIEKGRAVSRKVSISSFDDMELSDILGFSAARLRQPVTDIGCTAARLLLSRIKGDKPDRLSFPSIIRLKTTLVVNSTRKRVLI